MSCSICHHRTGPCRHCGEGVSARQQLSLRIVAEASRMGSLAELCTLVEYDPNVGRVDPPYWRPRHDVLELVESLLRP